MVLNLLFVGYRRLNIFVMKNFKLKSLIMQFLLLGYDGTDAGALDRRMAVREDHLKQIAVLKSKNEFIIGGAMLDDAGKMIGSMIVYEFPDRQSLDEMLKGEPYIINGVWKKIEIKPFRVAK